MKTITTLLCALTFTACASTPFKPKVRDFDPGAYPEISSVPTGSLVPVSGGGLLEDQRPSAVGDVIVINVDESDSASHDSSTQLDRSSTQDYGFTGALERLAPEIDLAHLFGATAESNFAGSGRIKKQGSVRATLPVRVRRLLPNGDLYVEGTKTVVIGEEKRHLYVSGIVRPIDVLRDGSISSSRIADAEIEYASEGDADDQQHQGWLAKLLTQFWPF